jgi:nucleotide-binding universal stress UspA family protein
MYKKILVPVDGSAASNRGLAEALKLAKSLGASVKVVHAVNEFIMDSAYAPIADYGQLLETLREVGRRVLKDAATTARAGGVEAQSSLVESIGGRAADLILAQAQEWSADLIVMGTHGRRGIRRLVLGSDAEQVLRSSPVPVLMVRAQPEAP